MAGYDCWHFDADHYFCCQPTVANTFNQTLQVNNYYVVTMGYDASELNMENYRIINQEQSCSPEA